MPVKKKATTAKKTTAKKTTAKKTTAKKNGTKGNGKKDADNGLVLENTANSPELSLDDLTSPEKVETKKDGGQKSEGKPDDWYRTGDAGYDEMLKQEAVNKARREKGVRRFYLGKDEGKNESIIAFLDNPDFYVWEHELNLSGDWKQRAYLTCSQDLNPCDVCGDGGNPYYLAYGTVFDTRKYSKKDSDEKVMNGRSLFGAKKNTMHRIRALMEKHGDLRGLVFKVKRFPGDKEPKVGSDFEYMGKIDLEKQFGKEESVPFEYKKILAHPTKDELKAYGVKTTMTFGSEEDLSKEEDSDLAFL